MVALAVRTRLLNVHVAFVVVPIVVIAEVAFIVVAEVASVVNGGVVGARAIEVCVIGARWVEACIIGAR